MLDLKTLTAGRDFKAVTLRSPTDVDTQFGYSVACTPTRSAARAPALAFSEYKADQQRGAVHLLSQRALDRMSVARMRRDLKTIRPAQPPGAWFGHEVDLADVTRDRRADLIVGARFAQHERGAAYFVNGKRLTRSRLTVSRRNSSVLVAETNTPRELGFATALVPSTGELAVSMVSGRNGSRASGAVARIRVPRKPGLRPLGYDDFLRIDPHLGQDFGRVINVDGRWLLLGSFADPGYTGLPYQPSRAWVAGGMVPRAVLDVRDVTGSGARHVSLARLHGRNVYGLMKPWRRAKSGVAVERKRATVLLTHPRLEGASFPYALDTGADVDGDGVDEIFASATEWQPVDRGLAGGAVVVVNGRDALERRRVRAVVLQFRGSGIRTIGSKRRLCVQRQAGATLVAAGAPYGRGGVVVARLGDLW